MQARSRLGLLSKEALGSLVLGFFHFYAHVIDWEHQAVSIRLGQLRDRSKVRFAHSGGIAKKAQLIRL